MRSSIIKWLLGSLAFLVPAMIAVIGMYLDKSPIRHDSLYKSLVPIVSWGAIILAAIVPTALVVTARMSLPRRASFVVAIWCMLIVQLYLILVAVLSGAH